MKSKIATFLFFLLWTGIQIFWLLWPYFGKNMSIAGIGAVFFLSSLPFVIATFWMPFLKVKQFWIIYILYFFSAIALYMGIGRLVSVDLKIIYMYQGITPLVLHLVLMGFFFGLVIAGLMLRRSFDRLEVSKGARDREELENYYEMKSRLLPEKGLTPFRYKQLIKISVSFVATRFNIIRAAIHLLPYENEFYFYDLQDSDLTEQERTEVIPYLLQQIFLRPEVRLNKPQYLIYMAREVDLVWDNELKQFGFLPISSDDSRITGFKKRMQGLLEIEFEDWTAFSEVDTWYVSDMTI